MKVYVISLIDELKRRESIINQFKKIGFDSYEFFDAVDIRALNNSEIVNYFDVDRFYEVYGRYPSKAEIGCTLSHFECLKKIAVSNMSGALIIEDDAIFEKGFENVLESNNLLDITILGYVKIRKNILLYHYIKEPIRKISNITNEIYLGKSRQEWRCGTVGYYVSQKSAKNILTYLSSLSAPYHLADDWRLFSSLVNVYHVRPLLVLEDFINMNSSIECSRKTLSLDKTAYHKTITRRIFSVMSGIVGHIGNFFLSWK